MMYVAFGPKCYVFHVEIDILDAHAALQYPIVSLPARCLILDLGTGGLFIRHGCLNYISMANAMETRQRLGEEPNYWASTTAQHIGRFTMTSKRRPPQLGQNVSGGGWRLKGASAGLEY